MGTHLNTERISILLDEPLGDLEAQAHLEACEACRAEFERLSHLRMALSGLGDLEAPEGQWAAIDAELDRVLGSGGGNAPIPIGGRTLSRLLVPGPLQAAAALVLFAGGVFAGLQLTGNAPGAAGGVPSVLESGSADQAIYDGLSELESLRGSSMRQIGLEEESPTGGTVTRLDADRMEVVQQLAKLNALIDAMRARLDENPGDPVANAVLLQALEDRDRLATEAGRALRAPTVNW